MARSKKLSDAEVKLKKREYDKKRREKIKSDHSQLEELREKERAKYLKKKQKGQVKPIAIISSREKRLKRKNWKKNSQNYRDRKAKICKNLTGPVHQNNIQRQSMVAIQRRKQLKKRRAIQYAKIARLEKKLKEETRKKDKFRKRYQRHTKKVLSSPEAIVSALLKNVQVPEIVKNLCSSTKSRKVQTRSRGTQPLNNFFVGDESLNNVTYNIGDHVLIKWSDEIYPGKITLISADAALVKCMEKGIKSWRWPTRKDKELYPWTDILQKIQPPKLI